MKLSKIFSDLAAEFKTMAIARSPSGEPLEPTIQPAFSRTGPLAFMLAIDTSPSMFATDYPPTRLDAAKAAAVAFVQQCRQLRPESRVGVVFFGGSAELGLRAQPAREAQQWIQGALDRTRVEGGTNISAGLVEARDELIKLGGKITPTIILLTDGDSNVGEDPVETAAKLKAEGIQLDIIGIGGSPSEVNEPDLRTMASVVEGQLRYWFIRDTPALIRKFEALALANV